MNLHEALLVLKYTKQLGLDLEKKIYNTSKKKKKIGIPLNQTKTTL